MKLLLKKGEFCWSKEGCHVVDERGFVVVLSCDTEVEFDNEQVFKQVEQIVSAARLLEEKESAKEVVVSEQEPMKPLLALVPELKKFEEPGIFREASENKDIPVQQFMTVEEVSTTSK